MNAGAIRVQLLLLGESGVGKTTLLKALKNQSSEGLTTTVGVQLIEREVEMEGSRIKVQAWDTAGQQRLKTLTPLYYEKMDAVLVVFDLSDKDTLSSAQKELQQLKQNRGSRMVVVLVGNKCDKARETETTEVKLLAERVAYREVSALIKQNSEQLFDWVVQETINKKEIKLNAKVSLFSKACCITF